MATSVFEGFQIKEINEERIPNLDENLQEPETYTVYLTLEPVGNSDLGAPPKTGVEIRQFWRKSFTKIWERDLGSNPESLPLIKYSDDNNHGKLRTQSTNLETIKKHCQYLIQLVNATNIETQKAVKESINYREKNEEYQKRFRKQVEQINSECFP